MITRKIGLSNSLLSSRGGNLGGFSDTEEQEGDFGIDKGDGGDRIF